MIDFEVVQRLTGMVLNDLMSLAVAGCRHIDFDTLASALTLTTDNFNSALLTALTANRDRFPPRTTLVLATKKFFKATVIPPSCW
jgi:hypothetical protein